MPDTKSISVVVRADKQGHWVEWTINGDRESFGPFQDEEMAENVRTAKERELSENPGRSL